MGLTAQEESMLQLGINIETLQNGGDHAQAENLIDLYGWDESRRALRLVEDADGWDIPAPTVRPQPDSPANWNRLTLILEWQVRNENRTPSDATGARAADLSAMLAAIPPTKRRRADGPSLNRGRYPHNERSKVNVRHI